jgi:lipid II:glycine glycyltransferase (peptidoglycan interpeptide bridge formation enzyme)
VSRNSFKKLMDFLDQTWHWKLYIATLDEKIIAWAIYIIDRENELWIYLYWWTDRSVHNTWASQLLHKDIFVDLKEMGIKTIDLLGGWPTWYPDHPLAKVGMFKEGFGWKKTDYEGSFDLVYKPFLYKIRALLRKHT